MYKFLYWFPRVLAILLIVFFAYFALDAFSMVNWALAFFMQLIPSLILIGLTIFAWRFVRVGGILFIIASIVALLFYSSVILAIPIFIVGIIFVLQSLLVKKK